MPAFPFIHYCFGGMAWWLGRVAVVGLAAKKTHVVYYEGDGTKVAIKLPRKSYGPAKTTPAARGSAEKVKFGWMLALPTEVAAAAGVRHGLWVRTTDDFFTRTTRSNARTIGLVIF